MYKLLFFLLSNTIILTATDNFKILPLYSANNITVPEHIGKKEKNKEFINLNTEDPITKQTFYKLIKSNSKKNLLFILAITKTLVNDKYYHHYFSAPELNIWLFGENYEKDPYDDFETYSYFNPANGHKINHTVLYFKINSLDSEFKYFCSDKDIFSESFRSSKYYQSYINGLDDNKPSQYYIGKKYFDKKSYQKAINWLENSLDNSQFFYEDNILALAKSYYIVKNHIESVKHFKIGAKELNNRSAQLSLGKLYEHGLGVNQNNYKAIKWYVEAYKNGQPKARQLYRKLLRSSLIETIPNKKSKIE